MSESCPRPRLAKIVLGIALVSSAIVIVCFAVGSSLYVQERSKVASYVKDLCQVQSASYETISKCIQETTRTSRLEKCFAAVWHVDYGENGKIKGTIRSDAERSYKSAETKSEQFKVCKSIISYISK